MAKCELEFYNRSGGLFTRSPDGCTGTATLVVMVGADSGTASNSEKMHSCDYCSTRLGLAGHVIGSL